MVDMRQVWKTDEKMQDEMRKDEMRKGDTMMVLKKDGTMMAGKRDTTFGAFWKTAWSWAGRRRDVKIAAICFSSVNLDPEIRNMFATKSLLFPGTFWLIAVSDFDFLISPSSPMTLAATLPSFRFGATFLSDSNYLLLVCEYFPWKLSCNGRFF